MIKTIYYDPAGYESLKNTVADAKQIDPSIELDDVLESLIHILSKKNKYVCIFHHTAAIATNLTDDDMMMI